MLYSELDFQDIELDFDFKLLFKVNLHIKLQVDFQLSRTRIMIKVQIWR